MKRIVLLLLIYTLTTSYGPPNCNLYSGDCKDACILAEKAIQYGQGSKPSQLLFDQSISKCPTFDYSYYEKSVPYAKRGQIVEWKQMIDQAVKLDPTEHLATRGWYHFFFLNNYEAAIKDLEELDRLKEGDLGTTGDAIYHLNILRGICYYELGELETAIQICEEQINDSTHYISLYDYTCLGVMYLKNKQYKEALAAFGLQEQENDLADNRFYKAQVYLELNQLDLAKEQLEIAQRYYRSNRTIENGYRELPFEIYQMDITEALASLE